MLGLTLEGAEPLYRLQRGAMEGMVALDLTWGTDPLQLSVNKSVCATGRR